MSKQPYQPFPDLAKLIIAWRDRHPSVSVSALARSSGMPRPTVSGVLNGTREIKSVDRLAALINACHLLDPADPVIQWIIPSE